MTALKVIPYLAPPFSGRPSSPVHIIYSSIYSCPKDPRKSPSRLLVRRSLPADASLPMPRHLLHSDPPNPGSSALVSVFLAKPTTKCFSHRAPPQQRALPGHPSSPPLPPSVSLRDWCPPGPAYGSRVSDATLFQPTRPAGLASW